MTDNRNVTELTVDELKSVVSEHSTKKLQATVKETMREVLISLGIDQEKPIEFQKDMAFLTKMRKMVDSLIMKTIAIIIAGVGVVSLLWKSFIKGEQ